MKAFDHEEKGRTAWIDRVASTWIQCQHADGKTWSRLDRRPDPGFKELATRRTFDIATPAKWNAYRLNLVAMDEEEGVEVSTLELNEEVDCQPGVRVESLTLDETAITLPVNDRATLNATLAPVNSAEREVAWESSDSTVAAVQRVGEQTALVVGKKPGQCVLTATVDGQSQACTVTVSPATLPSEWSLSLVGVSHRRLTFRCGISLTRLGHQNLRASAIVGSELTDHLLLEQRAHRLL